MTESQNTVLKRDLLAGAQAITAEAHEHYLSMRTTAAKKGRLWELTEEEFIALRGQPCALCGFNEGPVSIDRIDSTGGYTHDNVQPLCRVCQTIKSAFPQTFIEQHIERIHRHLLEDGCVETVLERDETPAEGGYTKVSAPVSAVSECVKT
jgi:hypothetical protein